MSCDVLADDLADDSETLQTTAKTLRGQMAEYLENPRRLKSQHAMTSPIKTFRKPLMADAQIKSGNFETKHIAGNPYFMTINSCNLGSIFWY